MEPYFSSNGISIYLGDCREVLPTTSDVHLFVTSPPYNQKICGYKPSGMRMRNESNWVGRISSAYSDDMPEDEYQRIQIEILNLCFASASIDGSMFYNHKLRYRNMSPIFPHNWLEKSNWSIRQEIIWLRDGSATQNARMFFPCDERIYWLRKSDHFMFEKGDSSWSSVWKIASSRRSEHPVAFPKEIPRRAIACCTLPNDVVCDPFCGGGTTLVAAVELKRKAIGIEKEERYCEMSAKAVENSLKVAV